VEENSNPFDIQYYMSSIFPIVFLSLGILFSHLLFGIGVLEEDTSTDTNSVVSFDPSLIPLLLLYLAFGSLLFYIIFTKLKKLEIRVIYAMVIGLSSLYLIGEISSELESESNFIRFSLLSVLLLLVFSFFIRFIYVYALGIASLKTRNLGILISSITLGRIAGVYFDIETIVYFAIILSLFDIWNVFRGPLTKLIGKPEFRDNLVESYNPSLDFNHIQDICRSGTPVLISIKRGTVIGIGDLFFFSLLLYRSFLEWNLLGHLITLFMLGLGSMSTLLLLTRINPLPGLPLPVFFSLLGFLMIEYLI
jgi:hypothetical protein